MKAVVGLGNPGAEYRATRHNIGFLVVESLLARLGAPGDSLRMERRFSAQTAKVQYEGESLLLAQPQTFMNRSGEAVGGLLRYHRIEAQDLVVVYDEAALPLGRLRIRPGGSAGGHNGMASTIQHLGTDTFPRVRIGVGGMERAGLSRHVLGRWRKAELPIVEDMVGHAVDAVLNLISFGVDEAMNRYNCLRGDEERA